MTGNQIREAYIRFFVERQHKEIPPAPIVPLNDPTTLFTPFGMQQMVPYLKGEPHAMGKRLVDSQPCFRTEDIDQVGDNRHTTFFEMLGNWSLGDYFKKEQLPWIFELATKVLGLDPKRLYVTVFEGSPAAPQDQESIKIWQELFLTQVSAKPGIEGFDPDTKIYLYEAKKNWWSRAGTPEEMPVGEIGGPDSELFYDVGAELHLHEKSVFHDLPCHVNCDCGRFLEIGNSVFMEYIKAADGTFVPLPAQNVDFGGGLERLTAVAQNTQDVFETDLFFMIIQAIETVSGKKYADENNKSAMRVIADHMKAAVFLIVGGVMPSNKMQGSFLRRLLRRVMVKMQKLKGEITKKIDDTTIDRVVAAVVETYTPYYFAANFDRREVVSTILAERNSFAKSLTKGLKLIAAADDAQIDGKFAFNLFQSYGFPLEITQELLTDKGINLDRNQFRAEFVKHQEKSRTATTGMFKGGLADQSETIVKYHTTTHLLHKALKEVLGDQVEQMGSNITSERLRFDFKHGTKLTESELKEIEQRINAVISKNLPVQKTIELKERALQSGAIAYFREKYPETVSVYTIGNDTEKDWYSKELCGGPHVASTGLIGAVKIKKEEAVGSGVRRIYMVLA
jgi:alanyl-tRNA synthetase